MILASAASASFNANSRISLFGCVGIICGHRLQDILTESNDLSEYEQCWGFQTFSFYMDIVNRSEPDLFIGPCRAADDRGGNVFRTSGLCQMLHDRIDSS